MPNWGVNDRQVAYWERVGLPHLVALQQAQWERRKAVLWMHRQGMTYAEIGLALGRSAARISQIAAKARRMGSETSPAVAHLTRWGELYDLTQSPHTMQMIGWLAGGQKPTIKLRNRVRVKQRPPFNPTEAEMAAIWDAFKDVRP